MKRLRAILIFLAAIFVVTVAWLCLERAHEPMYAGKSVSYWFGQYCGRDFAGNDRWLEEEAATALRAIGTNAVPYLAAEAFTTRPDTAASRNFYKLLERFPNSWHLPSLDDSQRRRDLAFNALAEIKPPASLVLPDIRQALKGTNQALRRMSVFLCGALGDGAEETVPFLFNEFRATDSDTQRRAIESIENLGAKGKAAVPYLVKLLHDEYQPRSTDHNVIVALGRIGSNAVPALLPLKRLFSSATNYNARCLLATALCQIDKHQDEAMTYLIQQLKTETNGDFLRFVIQRAGMIGANAQPAIPMLLDCVDAKSLDLSMAAMDAVKQIDPADERFLAKLKEKLKSEQKDVRTEAAKRLLELEPENREALSALLDVLRDNSPIYNEKRWSLIYTALDSLVRAGPAAKETLPTLRQVIADHPNLPNDIISQAIRHIEFSIKMETGQK